MQLQWATWCTSCIGEISELNKLKKESQGKGYEYYAINAGDTKKKIIKFLKKYPFDYTVLLDKDKKYSKSIGIDSLPHTLIIYKNKIIYSGNRPPSILK